MIITTPSIYVLEEACYITNIMIGLTESVLILEILLPAQRDLRRPESSRPTIKTIFSGTYNPIPMRRKILSNVVPKADLNKNFER